MIVLTVALALAGAPATKNSSSDSPATPGTPMSAADGALDLTAAANTDFVGEGRPISAADLQRALALAPTMHALDPAATKDAIGLRSASLPKAPKRVDLPVVGTGEELRLLATVDGDVPRGTPVLRVHFGYVDGTKSWVDLRSGDDLFPLAAGGSSANVRALPLGAGRALSLVSLRNPKPAASVAQIGLESRGAAATVYVLAAALGGPSADNPRPRADAERPGFPFPISLATPAPPVPEAWRVVGPVGTHGKLTTRDGHLAFADGTRARFWGINLLQEACTPPKELAPRIAKQLADNGFNLVRLHHCDTERAGTIRKDRRPGESPLDPAGVDRFDFFVAELAKAGVYVWLETATNRSFTEADGVSDPGPDVPNGHKLVPMFRPDWHDAYLGWMKIWLGRKNAYTGKTYVDDPAIATVELTNEHSVVMNWMTGGLERLAAPHRDALDAKWAAFVHARYPDEASMRAAWSGSINPGIRPGESFANPTRQPYGQASFGQWPNTRVGDLYDFYVSLEEPFFAELGATVRGLGYTQPIVAGITYGQPAVARIEGRFDVVDIHLEWDAPAGDTQRNDSVITHPRSQNLPDRFREAQLGKPFTVSELNHFHPNEHQSEAPLFWAAMAAVQDWDALVWLNYTNGEITEGAGPMDGPTELRFNAPKWGQMAQASGLFRSGVVPPAQGLLTSWRSDAEVRDEVIEGDRPSLPQIRDAGFLLGHRVRDAYGEAAAPSVAGEPGKVVGWWPGSARFVIDTPIFDAVLGDSARRFGAGQGEGGGPTEAGSLQPQMHGEAAVSLLCVEGPDIGHCKRGLLTVAGAAHNAGFVSTGGGAVTLGGGGENIVLTRPPGSVRFAWPRRPVVRPIFADGTRGNPIPAPTAGTNWWTIDLANAGETMWWEIEG